MISFTYGSAFSRSRRIHSIMRCKIAFPFFKPITNIFHWNEPLGSTCRYTDCAQPSEASGDSHSSGPALTISCTYPAYVVCTLSWVGVARRLWLHRSAYESPRLIVTRLVFSWALGKDGYSMGLTLVRFSHLR
jgi:hypothetical protein